MMWYKTAVPIILLILKLLQNKKTRSDTNNINDVVQNGGTNNITDESEEDKNSTGTVANHTIARARRNLMSERQNDSKVESKPSKSQPNPEYRTADKNNNRNRKDVKS